MQLNQKIAALMISKGIKARQLAAAANVPLPVVVALLGRNKTPEQKYMNRLMQFFKHLEKGEQYDH